MSSPPSSLTSRGARLSLVVFKPMKSRDVISALESNQCGVYSSKGRHTVYICPCGKHKAPVPASHTTITAGVVKSIGNQMACLPEGWLQ